MNVRINRPCFLKGSASSVIMLLAGFVSGSVPLPAQELVGA